MELASIQHKIGTKYIEYIIPSLSLTVALAWNSAFQSFFQENQYLNKYGPWFYAVIVTLLILTIIVLLDRAKSTLQSYDDDN